MKSSLRFRSCFLLAFALGLTIPAASNAEHIPADEAQKRIYAAIVQKADQSYQVDSSSNHPLKADEYWGPIKGGLLNGMRDEVDPTLVKGVLDLAGTHFNQYYKDKWRHLSPRQKIIETVKVITTVLIPYAKGVGWGAKALVLMKPVIDALDEKNSTQQDKDLSRTTVINNIQKKNIQETVNNYYIVFASEARDLASDPTFAAKFDSVFKNKIGVGVKASTQEMVQTLNLPGFATMVN